MVETFGHGDPYFCGDAFPGVTEGLPDSDGLVAVIDELVRVQVADVAVVDLDPVLGALDDVLAQMGVVEVPVVAPSVVGPGLAAVGSEVCSQVRSYAPSAPSCQAFRAAGPGVRGRIGPEVQAVG